MNKRKEQTEDMKIKQIIRTIAIGGEGQSVAEIDAYVSEWLDKGYILKSTHVLATPGSDGFLAAAVVLYVLTKE